MSQNACTSCQDSTRQFIGKKDDTIEVYALRAGPHLDSVFQLGVAHAHIVGNLPRPDLIVGLSSGAVHAAAIAEILRAKTELQGVENERDAELHRFRDILYAYQDFATDLQAAALPDAFEADAGKPLQPNPQAIHFFGERASRLQALASRSGLIALMNDLFSQSMTVQTVTRLVRAVAGWIAAAERPPKERRRERRRETWYVLKALRDAPGECIQFAADFIRAWICGTARLANKTLESSGVRYKRLLRFVLQRLEGRHSKGYTAGEIIFSRPRESLIGNAAKIAAYALGSLAVIGGWIGFTFFIHWIFGVANLVVTGVAGWLLMMELMKLSEHLATVPHPDRILAYYDLQRDLGSNYLITDLFIRLFDPTYYGTLDMNEVVDRAMRRAEPEREREEPKRRTFADYAKNKGEDEKGEADDAKSEIHVVPFVADLQTGKMVRVEATNSIVDGLRAAVSRLPFLPAVQLTRDGKTSYYVDASNISSDAAISAIDVLRRDIHPDALSARIFNVAPITLREPPSPARHPLQGTVDVALGGLELARFRDADDERGIIASKNDLMPERTREPERGSAGRRRALRCFGMEKDEPVHFVKADLVDIAPDYALHTSAEFLRAPTKEARQAIIAKAVAEGCRATLAAHSGRAGFGCRAMLGTWSADPGATEVCRHCAVYRHPWAAPRIDVSEPPLARPPSPESTKSGPTINLLFSGGVFRGVFQIGVLNALSELEVSAYSIAGSSVGSIVAAMGAKLFGLRDLQQRRLEVGGLAGTFLTLDQLIITDRFADFIRRFTLRAAEAKFSLRDTDYFFRNYDRDSAEFDAVARRVVGGIEHLFYVSPFELADLVREIRQQNYPRAYALLCRYAQEICDRGNVPFEVLGAEPLSLLIKQHVLKEEQRDRRAHGVHLGDVGSGDLAFLLTATNFTTRELQVIGSKAEDRHRVALLEALLASSAFPAIFRPRWAREIYFGNNSIEQFVDGGILDNLPLRAIVDHLYEAASNLEIEFRPTPRQPHLILAASLEPETEDLDPAEADRVGDSWRAASRRAQRLRYNQKIDRFRNAQRDLRYLYNRYAKERGIAVGAYTLDMEAVIVKPKWLCGTLAFHPMLGFRRKRQAASIAHGCAATFQTIARIVADENDASSRWPSDAWKMQVGQIDVEHARDLTPIDDPAQREKGRCHFRASSDAVCPFSRPFLDAHTKLNETVKCEIASIYELCGLKSTHVSPPKR